MQEEDLIVSLLDITERKKAEEEIQKRESELEERVKKLNCLYGISRLVEEYGNSLVDVLQGSVELIPPSWQYPEITCARLVVDDEEFSPEYYEKEKVEEIFEKTKRCTYPHCHVMTRLGYDCILRCAELVQACKEDVDLPKRALEVRAVKHSIPREVQFSSETAELLEPVMGKRKSGHLFLTYETDERQG